MDHSRPGGDHTRLRSMDKIPPPLDQRKTSATYDAGNLCLVDLAGSATQKRPCLQVAIGELLFKDQYQEEINNSAIKRAAWAALQTPVEEKRTSATHNTCSELAVDAVAMGTGLVTKFGGDKLLRNSLPGKVTFGAALITSGLAKDYLTDGQLGDNTQFVRGSAMFGLSILAIKGISLNPSRQMLSAGTTAGIAERLNTGTLAGRACNVSDLVLVENAGGSQWSRALRYVNPLCYTGFSWQNNCLRYVGFGGERTAGYLATGGMSFAEYNARRAIGNFGNSFGTAYTLAGGREAVYIGTGQTDCTGAPYTPSGAIARINNVGTAAGMTAGLKDVLQNIALRLR